MEGDEARRIYVLANGKVKLTQVTPDGRQVIMGYIVPGREFGLLAVLDALVVPIKLHQDEESF
jgi:CRP-like cAMP-binding protein